MNEFLIWLAAAPVNVQWMFALIFVLAFVGLGGTFALWMERVDFHLPSFKVWWRMRR